MGRGESLVIAPLLSAHHRTHSQRRSASPLVLSFWKKLAPVSKDSCEEEEEDVVAFFVPGTLRYDLQSWENQIHSDFSHESYLRIIGVASGDGSAIECQS